MYVNYNLTYKKERAREREQRFIQKIAPLQLMNEAGGIVRGCYLFDSMFLIEVAVVVVTMSGDVSFNLNAGTVVNGSNGVMDE